MESDTVFQLNSSHVVCQVLEGDAVLVHFESGLYYSVRGVAVEICSWMIKGHSVPKIVGAIVAQYDRVASQVEDEVSTFVERLVAAHLFVPVDLPPATDAVSFAAATYEKPQLEVFDDMADQLLLDKIEDETREAWVDPR